MRAEAFGEIGLLPDEFYGMETEEYMLTRNGYYNRVKSDMAALRYQTAILAGAWAKGGFDAVMRGWVIDDGQQVTKEDIKSMLKRKRENDMIRKLKKQGKWQKD